MVKNMQRRITTDDVERVLRERDPDKHPVVTSNYVADQTNVSRPTALSRLKDARDEGRVKQSEISQASVWWLSDDPITKERAAEHAAEVEDDDPEPEPETVTDGSVASPAATEVAELRADVLSKIEEVEEAVATAGEGGNSQEPPTAEAVGETVDERLQVHEQQQRESRASDRGTAGVLLGVSLSAVAQLIGGPEWILTASGALLLYGIAQLVYYVYLRTRP